MGFRDSSWGLGFGVSGFGLGFRVWGFGIRVGDSDLRFGDSCWGLRCRVLDFWGADRGVDAGDEVRGEREAREVREQHDPCWV